LSVAALPVSKISSFAGASKERGLSLKKLSPIAAFIFLACTCAVSPASAALSSKEQEIRDAVSVRADEAVGFLEKVVTISSGTMSHDGVRAVGAEFSSALEKLRFETSWESFPAAINRAGHLIALREGARGKKILLLGHLDTVFEAANRKFTQIRLRHTSPFSSAA